MSGVPQQDVYRNVKVVEHVVECAVVTKFLSSLTPIAVGVRGESLSRNGTIELVQIAVEVSDAEAASGFDETHFVFLFDITKLGARAFKSAKSGGGGLGAVLRSSTTEKIFYDVRASSDALYHLFGVRVRNALDLQVLYTLCHSSPSTEPERLVGLEAVMAHFVERVGLGEAERGWLGGVLRRDAGSLDSEDGWRPGAWGHQHSFAVASVRYLAPMADLFVLPEGRQIPDSEVEERWCQAKEITEQRVHAAISRPGPFSEFRDFGGGAPEGSSS